MNGVIVIVGFRVTRFGTFSVVARFIFFTFSILTNNILYFQPHPSSHKLQSQMDNWREIRNSAILELFNDPDARGLVINSSMRACERYNTNIHHILITLLTNRPNIHIAYIDKSERNREFFTLTVKREMRHHRHFIPLNTSDHCWRVGENDTRRMAVYGHDENELRGIPMNVAVMYEPSCDILREIIPSVLNTKNDKFIIVVNNDGGAMTGFVDRMATCCKVTTTTTTQHSRFEDGNGKRIMKFLDQSKNSC